MQLVHQVRQGRGDLPVGAEYMLDALFLAACQQSVSDIHIQPVEAFVQIRFRIDGVLADYDVLGHEQAAAITSRLKVLSGLDITQHRVAQDGALRIAVHDRLYDVRVSIFPSLYGEKLVMRLLSQTHAAQQLATLALPVQMVDHVRRICQQLQGFFLVTGPTGAGKTTTLYAMLREVDRRRRNVVTLEDPIEYRIDGVTQTQINPQLDFTFAAAMRCLLRQDPDVALIGEMRDVQTARSAIEAALTGHLVLSSLHTTQASAVPIRLREMGIEPYLIASSLTGVLAQRLVPLLCVACKKPMLPTKQQQAWAASYEQEITQAWQAPGCSTCHHTGRQGRLLLAELWMVDEAARALIMTPDGNAAELQAHALAGGMVPLVKRGIDRAQEGMVALEAIMRL